MTDSIRIGVDVGGTFTDVVLVTPDGLFTAKVPSTPDQSEGVITGIERACARGGVAPEEIDAFSHAMTVATNALLEETGAKTALITTAGFRDVLEIARQDRPDLYDLDTERPQPLVPRRRRFEIDERATPEGIDRAVDETAVRELADVLDDREIESVAVCLLHAYAHPENEQRVESVLRDELDVPVSVSHDVLAEFREYERTSTTVVDAYVTPVIDSYLRRLEDRASELEVPAPSVMQSNGGIVTASTARTTAVTTALSGPAAGVVGATATIDVLAEDIAGAVTFDMGGTSSDVGLVRAGEIERTTETTISGRPIATPMVDVTTVGAGGGSIAWVDDGGALRVGPASAGATPGPACYGHGGTDPTVTDANVVLGYIGSDTVLGEELTIDADAARRVLEELAVSADLDGPLAAAQGVHRVVNANMTRAVRSVTVERGYDPRRFVLVGFGGAGPMHAAELADRLDIDTVVIALPCGVLSAYGLLAADEKHDGVRTHKRRIDELDGGVEDVFENLTASVLSDVTDPNAARVERSADLRYVGQSFELTVPVDDPLSPEALCERFHTAHETTYGYRMDEAVELVSLRITATTERDPVSIAYDGGEKPHISTRKAFFDGAFHETPVYDRRRLPANDTVDGPAILEQSACTTVIPPVWSGAVHENGTIILSREQ